MWVGGFSWRAVYNIGSLSPPSVVGANYDVESDGTIGLSGQDLGKETNRGDLVCKTFSTYCSF